MENLPLELLQRVCGSFSESPNELKSIRLVSKGFANAGALYLIPRVFLFKHPDSFTEVHAIASHPIFCKRVTTLIVDLSIVKNYPMFEDWMNENQHNHGRAQDQTAWQAHQDLLQIQSSVETKQALLESTSIILQACPNLTNIVFALTGGKHSADEKRSRFFRAINPQSNSWSKMHQQTKHDPALWDVLRAVEQREIGLGSLTMTNTVIKCANYSVHGNSAIFNTLKHLRIGYSIRERSPKTEFGLDLGNILSAAHCLETFWIDTANWITGRYCVDDDLRSVRSPRFRDLILSRVLVSEDALVEFLLRYSHSLQRLSFGGIRLTPGTWESLARRISCRMSVLKGVQMTMIGDVDDEDEEFAPSYVREIEDFILKGGEFPELAYLRDNPEEDMDISWNEEMADRKVEKGLWKDYDGANFYFRYE